MNRIPLCLNIKVVKILAVEKMVRNRCMKFCHVFTRMQELDVHLVMIVRVFLFSFSK